MKSIATGIPYRRGYLLHGEPGSGKTSLIQALAGELSLDLYMIPLGRVGVDDNSLDTMVSNLPPSCIALIEDIDCAFRKWVSSRESQDDDNDNTLRYGVTLSGLLNAIDGVAAHEGRMLFATTNIAGTLDPALIRPGRMDRVIEFKNATRKQAEALFKNFFPAESTVVHKVKHGRQESNSAELSDTVPLLTPPSSAPASPVQMPSWESNRASSTPSLTTEERDLFAARFALGIPDGEFSMAAFQGCLMLYKDSPRRCADEVGQWVAGERQRIQEHKELEMARRKRKQEKQRKAKKARAFSQQMEPEGEGEGEKEEGEGE